MGDCGEICQTGNVVGKDQYFEFIEKKIDCTAIFHELPSGMTISPPPQDIPKELAEEYSLGGAVRLSHRYFNETQTGGKLNITWSASMIDREVEHASNEKFDQMNTTTYGGGEAKSLHDFFKKHRTAIEGHHCAVVGSQKPWVETILLAVGAAHVTTIEYGTIISEHKRISTMYPNQLLHLANASRQWARSRRELFDCIVSFSSLEHSGLGRYGDPLDPFGDIRTMAQLQCVSKPNAAFFIGMPYGKEELCWNAHRVYGPKRSAQLFANIHVKDTSKPKYVIGGKYLAFGICRNYIQPVFFGRKAARRDVTSNFSRSRTKGRKTPRKRP